MRDIACWDDRRFPFEPAATALLAIDMQRDFLDPEGMCAVNGDDVAPLQAIVPAIERLCRAARRAGVQVIHTREGYAPDLADVHPMKAERGSVGTPGPLGRFLIRGEAGHDFIDACTPAADETVIDKPGFSAFYRTDLEDRLKTAGIDRLILTGVTTQCCVQSTLRDAVDRGFYCLTVADACAAVEPALHAAVLTVIQGENHLFGWIAETADVLAALDV